ncbi:barstar family protein [Streptomyces sp. H34-S4]|uniref:barstar family protein n=1 Tax=Streptomyces sp. H34-S4 TaxID=2996463 RepID=UPI00226FCE5A|nr:barstar family protein [Streptomyces sp. H34-S4]MCY0936495.1 barstar family protein [Streptomyces sp. H34-S4]
MTLDPQPLAPALEAAEAAGWTTVRLDLDGVRTKAELMRRCEGALELPDWFGGNWDALADALKDLSWLPDAAGRLVAVTSWRGYAAARPGDWETLREILEEATDFWRGGLSVLLAEPVPEPAPEPVPEPGVKPKPGPAAGGQPRAPRLKRRRG